MANVVYPNFYLANEVEDAYLSHLNLQNFCIVNNDLVGVPGMKHTTNTYSATDGVQKLTIGVGNNKEVEVSYVPADHDIILAQTRFKWFDEHAMTDPMLVPVGMNKLGADLYNTVNDDIYTEWKSTSHTVAVSGSAVFDAFVDAIALLTLPEDQDKNSTYTINGFVAPTDMATIRKALKDDLKYIEAFVRRGYVGTVAGVNLYVKRDATAKTIVIATPKAATVFNKKGVEIEQERDANIRENTAYARKYYVAALTDEDQAATITLP